MYKVLHLLPFMAATESFGEALALPSPPLPAPFMGPFLSLPAGRRGASVKSACFTKATRRGLPV